MSKRRKAPKGYRKYTPRKNIYSKQELYALFFTIVALIAVVYSVAVLPQKIEDRQYLKVKNGIVQNVGENWLIKNFSETDKPRFRKVAEIDAAIGYVLDHTEPSATEEQELYYYYRAENPDAALKEYYAFSGNSNYDVLSYNSLETIQNFVGEVLYAGDVVSGEAYGNKYNSYTLEYLTNQAEEGQKPDIVYVQMVNLYVDSPIDDTCVILSSTISGGSTEAFGNRDALLEGLISAIPSISFEQ